MGTSDVRDRVAKAIHDQIETQALADRPDDPTLVRIEWDDAPEWMRASVYRLADVAIDAIEAQ